MTPDDTRGPLHLGLTGNIASGKSAVADILARLGATVIDADQLAREAVQPGTPALAGIVARWGPDILRRDGTLDRARLRAIVFSDRAEREALNAIVHPEIGRLRALRLADARSRGARVVLSVIPLLFETGLEREVDRVILVDAPDEIRRRRLVERRGLSTAEAERMMAAQMPATLKRARADFIIDNTGTLEDLETTVMRLWRDLTA